MLKQNNNFFEGRIKNRSPEINDFQPESEIDTELSSLIDGYDSFNNLEKNFDSNFKLGKNNSVLINADFDREFNTYGKSLITN